MQVSLKYAEALQLQHRSVERVRRSAACALPDDLDYHALTALSNEEVQKLSAARPRTLQEASQISGVTPSGLAALLIALREHTAAQAEPKQRAVSAEKQRRKALVRAALAQSADGSGGDG